MANKTLVEMEIKRVHNGVLVKVRSKIFNAFFKNYGLDFNPEHNWSGNLPYKLGFTITNDNYNSLVNGWRSKLMISSHIPNLAFIKAENLDEWQRFLITHPTSNEEIKNFHKYFGACCLEFYNEIVIPIQLRDLVKANPDLKKIKKGLSKLEQIEVKTFDVSIDQVPDVDFSRIFADLSSRL